MVVPGARNPNREALFFDGKDGEVRSRANGRVGEVVTKKHAEKTSCPNEPAASAVLGKKIKLKRLAVRMNLQQMQLLEKEIKLIKPVKILNFLDKKGATL